jgi:sporulation protein YlmC with PRC-barrel domain
MVLNLRKLSEVYNLKVYTEEGMYLGDVEDVLISENKIYGWKIRINDPELIRRGAKGLIIQHQLVKAIGQIMIVSRVAYPIKREREAEEESS